MEPQEIIMTLNILFLLNIKVLIKFITLKYKFKYFSLLHINVRFLNKHFDDLQHLLSCTENKFDIIGVTEARITKKYLYQIIQISITIVMNFVRVKLLQGALFFLRLINYPINVLLA